MDEQTYARLKLGTPHEEKDPPGGMVNLNTGAALSFEDPGGFDAGYRPHPQSVERGEKHIRGLRGLT